MKKKRMIFFLIMPTISSFLSCRSTEPSTARALEDGTLLPPLGEEYAVPPADEGRLSAVISQLFQGIVDDGYKSRKDSSDARPARRDAHAKHHGCMAAEFQVESDLPQEFQHGVFTRPSTYKAFVRFSSGSPFLKDDRLGDAHGMAIKLLNIEGPMALSADEAAGENNSQDFVMIDHPVFFMRTAHTYIPFVKAQSEGAEAFRKFIQDNPHEGALALATASKKPDSSLAQSYFSQTAYKLGPNAMKFSARPCVNQNLLSFSADKRSADYLRETISEQMKSSAVCYDFLIQLQRDSRAMPVEDPTIEWPAEWDGKGTYQKVATLNIPVQDATSEVQLRACEDMSFSPWHSLLAQKPIGGINRVRRQVYIETSRHRHELNKAALFQPNEETWQAFLQKKK